MFLGFQQVVAGASVKTVTDLNIPANDTHAEVQADTQTVRYNMNNATDPTQTVGMQFLVTSEPKSFLIEDIRRIRFIRGAGSDGNLNIHYFGGRNI